MTAAASRREACRRARRPGSASGMVRLVPSTERSNDVEPRARDFIGAAVLALVLVALVVVLVYASLTPA